MELGNYCVLQSIINAYSLLSHEWWVPLIKFMVGPSIYVREGVCIYGTPKVSNNFPMELTNRVNAYINYLLLCINYLYYMNLYDYFYKIYIENNF